MKTYSLTLKQKSGLLTELQSDTIYGHFCWRMKENLSEDKLTEFISAYKNSRPVFLLSDGFLTVNSEIHFPRPYIFSQPELKEKKEDKIIEFLKQKKSKERDYLTLTELNSFLSTGNIPEINDEVVEKKNKKKSDPILSESLRVSAQIDRNTFGSMEGRLFSYNPKHTRADVSYTMLVKIMDERDESSFETFQCEKILKEVFTLGFGKKKSSGYGQFEVGELTEFNEINQPPESNGFIVLGNYLPSSSDNVKPIGYDINTKYGKLGEELSQSENPFKNPIVFLIAGSCFKTENQKKFYGRVTSEGEISKSNSFAVQFGIPFTLNFKVGIL